MRRHVSPAYDLTTTADITAAYAELAARLAAPATPTPSPPGCARGASSSRSSTRTACGAASPWPAPPTTPPPSPPTSTSSTASPRTATPRATDLAQAFVAHPHARHLDPAQHACLLRTLADQVDLHRDESSRARDRGAAPHRRDHAPAHRVTTIEWDGAPRSLADVEAALDGPRRARREQARARSPRGRLARRQRPRPHATTRRRPVRPPVAVRQAQARAAGCPDVRAHRFRRLGRRLRPRRLPRAARRDRGRGRPPRQRAARPSAAAPTSASATCARGTSSPRSAPTTSRCALHRRAHARRRLHRAIASVDPELGRQFAASPRAACST
jgi:hypothetical protein